MSDQANAVQQALRGAHAAVYWQDGDPRWRPSDMVPLTGAERAGVCIVGGGFTGLWTALSVKRLAPEADVVLVEREYCGAGASGRNGGWVNGWDDALPRLVSHFGRDAALGLLDFSQRSLDDITDTVRDGAIDCDLAFAGGLVVALSPAQVDGVLEPSVLASELGREGLFRAQGRHLVAAGQDGVIGSGFCDAVRTPLGDEAGAARERRREVT